MDFTGFAVDSRKVTSGGLFFALLGAKVDGHLFLTEVATRGAKAAVVKEGYQGDSYGLELIRVKDPLETLHQMAKDKMQGFKGLVVGITGSVGKTTTKEFTAELLEARYKVLKTINSENGQTGLPLTILNAKYIPEIFVFEMGMSEPGEMKKLIEIVSPDIALVTKIAPAHTQHFSGLEDIAREKSIIFSGSTTRIVWAGEAVMGFKAFQDKPELNVFSNQDENSTLCIKKKGEQWEFFEKGKSLGMMNISREEIPWVENFTAAVAIARTLGITFEQIKERISALKTAPHRFELKSKDGILFIDDSYNANLESIKAALFHMPSPQNGGRSIAVFGEMPEQGWYSETCHREVGRLSAEKLDEVLCFGEVTRPLYEEFVTKSGKSASITSSFEDLKKQLFSRIKKGDVVLIKGANKLKLWELLDR